MAENTIKALMAYFSTPDRPCLPREMMEFWKELSDSEKEYYKFADLS